MSADSGHDKLLSIDHVNSTAFNTIKEGIDLQHKFKPGVDDLEAIATQIILNSNLPSEVQAQYISEVNDQPYNGVGDNVGDKLVECFFRLRTNRLFSTLLPETQEEISAMLVGTASARVDEIINGNKRRSETYIAQSKNIIQLLTPLFEPIEPTNYLQQRAHSIIDKLRGSKDITGTADKTYMKLESHINTVLPNLSLVPAVSF